MGLEQRIYQMQLNGIVQLTGVHALSKKQDNHSKITKKLLSKSIAIPIWLKKSLSEYSIIGKKIKDI